MTNTRSSLSLSPYSDIAGFSSLASRLRPGEVVRIINHFHTLVDEAFTHPDIFLMERSSSGCVAACGLVEGTGVVAERPRSGAESQLSMTDSSYGSVPDLNEETETWRHCTTPSKHIHQQLPDSKHIHQQLPDSKHIHQPSNLHSQRSSDSQRSPQYFASVLATAALTLMSNTAQIEIPNSEKNGQIQLRIGLHSGPCSTGVIGLQTAGGNSSRIPHYKLFGVSLGHTRNLCLSGLALQIRVSKPCQELLASTGVFQFERCPDYTMWCSRRAIESFWLVGKKGVELSLPSLELALPLTEYDDTQI